MTIANISKTLPSLCRRLGDVQYCAPAGLTPYGNNPRKHPEKQIIKLMASIEEFGFALPALVDASNVIIAGEARIEAAKRLGLAQVPVIVASHWSKAQVKAYRLADNRLAELSHFDEQVLAVELASIIELDETPIEIMGWETAEIDILLDAAGEDEAEELADEAIEVPVVPTSRPGDLWQLDHHRLLCGSSLEAANWVRLMDGKIAAMVLSDPPWNVPVNGHVSGLGKVKHDEFAMASGEMTKSEFTGFLTEFIGKAAYHLKDGAIIDLFIDWRHILEMQSALDACGLSVINVCIWNKVSGPGMGSLYRSQHELVFVAKKGKAPHTNNVQLGKYGRVRSNIWSYPGATGFSKTRMADLAAHPTVKNSQMIADAIRDVTNPGEIVLDGFMGSGTTILAAERTKRIAYGIEIEPKFIDVALRRWMTMTGKQPVLADTGETFEEVAAARAAAPQTNDTQAESNAGDLNA